MSLKAESQADPVTLPYDSPDQTPAKPEAEPEAASIEAEEDKGGDVKVTNESSAPHVEETKPPEPERPEESQPESEDDSLGELQGAPPQVESREEEKQAELRQRKQGAAEESEKPEARSSVSPSEFFGKMKPYLEKGIEVYQAMQPYIEMGKGYYNQALGVVQPYYDKYWRSEFNQIIIGAILLFFGGHFAMTLACYTAVQLTGWKLMRDSYLAIKNNYYKALYAAEHDEDALAMLDTDGDGRVSISETLAAGQKLLQGSTEDKFAMLGNLRAVFIAVDPQQVMNGFVGIWSSILTVMATLKSRFAKDVALGVSIGDALAKTASRRLKPFIEEHVDEDMQKWAEFAVDFFFKSFGIALALMLVRASSAFQSAIKGGQLIALHLFAFLANAQLIPEEMARAATKSKDGKVDRSELLESNMLFNLVTYGLAAYGFYWQLMSGFAINRWYLRLFLWPFSLVEGVLTWCAAYQ